MEVPGCPWDKYQFLGKTKCYQVMHNLVEEDYSDVWPVLLEAAPAKLQHTQLGDD